MRVCQFRHYGTVNLRSAGDGRSTLTATFSLSNVAAAVNSSSGKCGRRGRGLCCRWGLLEASDMPVAHCVRLLIKKGVLVGEEGEFSQMTEKNLLSQAPSSNSQAAFDVEKIPEDLSVEMRRIAHDLSNALEIIIQTSYLLGTTEMKAP